MKTHNESNSSRQILNWKKYWKINLSLKVLIFGWKCISNGIVVNVVHNSKLSEDYKLCPLCKGHNRTIEHALFHYNHARAAWFSSCFGVMSHKVLDNGLVEWWRNIISLNSSSPKIPKEAKTWIIATCWAIWNTHNDFILGKKRLIH